MSPDDPHRRLHGLRLTAMSGRMILRDEDRVELLVLRYPGLPVDRRVKIEAVMTEAAGIEDQAVEVA
jgi:hypothetical protein